MSNHFIKHDALSDRLTQSLELAFMEKPPEQEALLIIDMFGGNASQIAENCIEMMGEIGTDAATDYWSKVYNYIKLHSVRQ